MNFTILAKMDKGIYYKIDCFSVKIKSQMLTKHFPTINNILKSVHSSNKYVTLLKCLTFFSKEIIIFQMQ